MKKFPNIGLLRLSLLFLGFVMCLSAMAIDIALCVVMRWPLNAVIIFQMSCSGVNILKLLMKSVQDSLFAFLITFLYSGFAFLSSKKFPVALCFWNLFLNLFFYI